MSEMLIDSTFFSGPPSGTPFQFKITTNNSSYQLPLQQYLEDGITAAVYDFYVDWGNGEPVDHITAWNQSESEHPYSGDNGEYTIAITGDLSAFGHVDGGDNLGDKDMITEFVSWGDQTTHDAGAFTQMFYQCTNMVYTATDSPDLTGVTLMVQMFYECENLGTGGDFSGWDVSEILDMQGLFGLCTDFNNATITGWDVSKNEYFYEMLDETAFDQDISGWEPVASTSFDKFTSAPFSTANYDLLLNAWSLLTFDNTEMDFGIGTVKYTIATSQAARDILTGSPNDWYITDGGGI